jgi:hypothetical protein
MKKIKITFTISEDVVQMLDKHVPKRKRSAFIEEAIRFRFGSIEQEQFLRELVMSNKARDEELDKIDADMELGEAIFQSEELLNDDEILEFEDLV